jgi:hypothetical protein
VHQHRADEHSRKRSAQAAPAIRINPTPVARNQSHMDAFLVNPSGDWRGTLGEWYFLYRRQGRVWTVEKISRGKDDENGWQTSHPRFDVLATARNGHHDLRVVVDGCLKWDGAKYVWYEPEDYRRLSPEWFNAADHREAEIFWAIRYAGLNTMRFVRTAES